ncbi:MAG: MoxR family ATPase [bacterium]
MSDKEKISLISKTFNALKSELAKAVIGQDEVVEQLLISLFAKGHAIIVGVPGLAKTLLVATLARILDLKFSRIQFTPDLMPSDITGTDIIEEDLKSGRKNFRFIKGPVFANIILADEINRTPPKTQSALLEAMQEYKVTAGGNDYFLEQPFFVLGTQNPIEQEGTYPLPEAQLDRFFFQINIFYPGEEEEKKIALTTTAFPDYDLKTILTKKEILGIQDFVRKIPIPDNSLEYAVKLVKMTRLPDGDPDVIKWISWGAGPRASQALVLAAKIKAALDGRFSVSKEDIRDIAFPALRHRLVINFSAEAEGITADDIIRKMLEKKLK